MTAHFLIDAIRPLAPLRQGMGAVVENFFRPSESVTDGGAFDSVRLTPHSAHDDRALFGRNEASLAWRLAAASCSAVEFRRTVVCLRPAAPHTPTDERLRSYRCGGRHGSTCSHLPADFVSAGDWRIRCHAQ